MLQHPLIASSLLQLFLLTPLMHAYPLQVFPEHKLPLQASALLPFKTVAPPIFLLQVHSLPQLSFSLLLTHLSTSKGITTFCQISIHAV